MRGFDVVHVHGLDGLADTLVRRRSVHGARVGVSTHGGYFHTTRQSWIKSMWLRTITRRTLALADAVWFTSSADRRRFGAGVRNGVLLRDGVDVRRFSAIPRSPVVGRWLVPGRVEAHKGLADLLAVFAGALHAHDITLQVVGPLRDPQVERALRASIAEHGLIDRVILTGQVDDDAYEAHFASCELALFPSRYEGFGVALVEAMAAGVPVVVSPIDAFAEIVTDGEDGYVVDFQSASAMDLLLPMSGADHSRVSQAARRAAHQHAWSARVEEYERAYAALLEDA